MRKTRSDGGSALAVTLLAVLVVAGAGAAMVVSSESARKEEDARALRSRRRIFAETAVARAVLDLAQGGSGDVGSAAAPVPWSGGAFWAVSTDNGDGTFSVDGYGRDGTRARGLRTVVREIRTGMFDFSMFAGNSSGDPAYALTLGGVGNGADLVEGDVYSGGGIVREGDAKFTGGLRATGTITGAEGTEGYAQPSPDLGAQNYEVSRDVDVAAEFAANGFQATSASYGGKAGQVPEASPAHIFRRNPDDRKTETSGTAKNDYFLEDPYEKVSDSSTVAPGSATPITLSGVSGEPGANGSDKVYFIDGNLWVHNKHLYSLVFRHKDANGVRVTFVVKGNVYLSDNLLLTDAAKDGVALIAMKDPKVPDSGNIYFGDPVFGTLREMQAFMYAENDFHDNSLSQNGSTKITVRGTMSAGDQVDINRPNPKLRPKLELLYDPRVQQGVLTLPGVPGNPKGSKLRRLQTVTTFELPGVD